MPIVLDYSPSTGAILGGTFHSHVTAGAVETGTWQVVLPGAVYARQVLVVDPAAEVHGFLGALGDGQMALVDGGQQQVSHATQVGQQQVKQQQEQQQQQQQHVSPNFEGLVGEGVVPRGASQGLEVAVDGAAPHQVSPGLVQSVEQALAPPPAFAQPHFADDSGPRALRPRPRSPSPAPAAETPSTSRASKRRRVASCIVTLPIAVHIEGTSGAASVANTADPNKRATPSAANTPHVGPVFKTHRAILLREDEPYICSLCGEGFAHPMDVKAHFLGRSSFKGAGCKAVHGGAAADVPEWNAHASCKALEEGVTIARVKEGWVVVDRGSWERIEGAIGEGRAFKVGRGGQVAMEGVGGDVDGAAGVQVVESGDGASDDGDDTMIAGGEAAAAATNGTDSAAVEEAPRLSAANDASDGDGSDGDDGSKAMSLDSGSDARTESVEPSPPLRKEPPKRKVVRAGDVTETDVGVVKKKK